MNETMEAQPLLNRGMKAVLLSQFISAFADNVLFFAILAQLKAESYPGWSLPALQIVFVLTYIVLAPFVGQIADRFPKGRVMLFSNGIKLLGAISICIDMNPFLGYTLVGIGAAAYSPAKYGILGELTGGGRLVKANGMMEASTIAAILIGSVVGGFLSDINLIFALGLCALLYGVAVVANFYIPRLVAARQAKGWAPIKMLVDFMAVCASLWRNQETRFSLVGTSLFWGAGVTLRFLLVAWVPVVLGIEGNTTPTLMNAVVAVGIILGAGLAARFITLNTVRRCMPAGILIGLMVILFATQQSIWLSYLILIVLGIFGGLFVVPLNALLQEHGRHTMGAGKAVAVQNFGENSAMLIMLGLYLISIWFGASAVAVGIGFGISLSFAIGGLWIWDMLRKN
ncbi:lysophospholipid transporter LplT [Xenorhabdus nematophila]|uniref:Efflux protein, resistance protein n=1 Tax=Xenorhabdus nematophila (strain ATCC 19061 / DSM 3370 / CCUG 14189 / LMG 1036 / NCIMB 9965 / AN6) TaxID=406817 RepID=D3V9U2_XENNA|nr:lysophospholipid transporter LplT [Xenorhabdus nematophila]CEE95040.1 putative efflux protein, resistance protein [Xenorhabdus nematophila str. Anatoliense]CEF31682.1 putative efflux protein, resistance protein [Xenorhabdus nematophila str. Websteri]AYA39560.1 lysophospholipid transporter LplT [Xenorhabdus nematophila]KHD28139.1 lysophospholipid transporter LplT [Xenorhabdus nematophila]MBA0018125.1 lysophospholipid transporter LplT [Xenorhabdus nematophila]